MKTFAKAAVVCVSLLFLGCEDDSPKFTDGGAGGTAGKGGAGGGDAGSGAMGGAGGGTGGTGGIGGTGGTGGTTPDTDWIDDRPDNECTTEELGRIIGTGLENDVARVGVYPKLAVGTSWRAVVERYEDDGARIVLQADEEVVINLAGLLGPADFALGSKVNLEQTRSWTIIRTTESLYAMFWRVGDDIPDGTLDPIPFGGPSLRFVLQCNRIDATTCAPEAVALESDSGAGVQRYPSGEAVTVGDWKVENRTLLMRTCPQDPTAFRSMIVVAGRPAR